MRQVDEDSQSAQNTAEYEPSWDQDNTSDDIIASSLLGRDVDDSAHPNAQLIKDLSGGIDPDGRREDKTPVGFEEIDDAFPSSF